MDIDLELIRSITGVIVGVWFGFMVIRYQKVYKIVCFMIEAIEIADRIQPGHTKRAVETRLEANGLNNLVDNIVKNKGYKRGKRQEFIRHSFTKEDKSSV